MIGLEKDAVFLYDYSENWSKEANKTIKKLKKILQDTALDIEHIGSSAVKGIKSKPIIDLVVKVESFDKLAPFKKDLESHGIIYLSQDEKEVVYGCKSYYEGRGNLETHFIYFVLNGSMEWLNYLNFRNYLNKNKKVRKDYENLKMSIIENLKENLTRENYAAAKSDFIDFTLRKALVDSFMGKSVLVKMDRPIGSPHPKRKEIIYPINYGFIPNVFGGDDEELDVYLLKVDKPVLEYKAKIIAIIHRFDDVEDKLVAAPVGMTFSKKEIEAAVNFQEKYYKSTVEVYKEEV